MKSKIVKYVFPTIIILLGFFSISYAGYDEEYRVDLWDLGDLSSPTWSGYNPIDFTIVEEGSDVRIEYVAYDCEFFDDFYIYINGISPQIPCSGGVNNMPMVEYYDFINMSVGTYEVIVDYNFGNFFKIGEIKVQISYPIILGTGTGILLEDDTALGNINRYFTDDFTIEQLMFLEIGLYLLAIICIFLFKVMDMINNRIRQDTIF